MTEYQIRLLRHKTTIDQQIDRVYQTITTHQEISDEHRARLHKIVDLLSNASRTLKDLNNAMKT